MTLRAFELEHVRVGDCMHRGILSCAPDAPLGEVAGMMAKHHVHAIAVMGGDSGRPAGVVTALDVAAAAASGSEPTAFGAAVTEPLTISSNEPLSRAAQLMSEHGVSHLIVVDAAGGYPVGIVSTLDIAAVYSGGTRA